MCGSMEPANQCKFLFVLYIPSDIGTESKLLPMPLAKQPKVSKHTLRFEMRAKCT